MINLDVGSIWRKWDLHVHAPTSVFANQFGGNTEEAWEDYITDIEQLRDISVLGITDYWSLEGYKKVMEYKDNRRLDNIELILPNVEMRLSTFTPAGSACNFHCIFNPDYVEQLESRFFGKLSFKLNQRTYTCQKEELIALGKAHSGDNELSNEAAYKQGCNQFKVSHIELFDIFAGDPDLRKNAFLIIPNSNRDGNSGIQDNNYAATRHDVYRAVDAIFTANPRDIDYFLGHGADNEKEIERKYGRLKPCIHGSDAHSNETLCKPSQDRFTWIKSICTFDGLKQIIFEPEDRVHIGEIKPETKNTYQTISSLKIESNDFPSDQIPINRNLTTIIGGKSTGKSLLLYHIAKTADSYEVASRLKEMDREEPYPDLASFNLILNWADGTTSSLEDSQSENDDFRAHKVTYIPQSYLNRITEHQKNTVDEIIKNLLLQNDATKKSYELFEESKRDKEHLLKSKIDDLFLMLEQWRTATQEAKAIGNKEGIESYIIKLQTEITSISTKYGFTESEISQKEDLENQRLEKEQKIYKLIADNEQITRLITNIENLIDFSNLDESIRQLSDLSAQILIAHTEESKNKLFGYLKTKYNERANLIPSEIDSIREEIKIVDIQLTPLREKASLQSGLGEKQIELLGEKEKLQKINTYNNKIANLAQTYNNTKSEILDIYRNIHTLYKDIIKNLETGKDNLTVGLDISVSYSQNLFKEGFYEPLIDKRSQHLENIFPKYDPANPEEHFNNIEKGINDIIAERYNFNGTVSREDALKRYMGSYFHIDYVIKYQGDEFDKMSVGKSSLVLLKLLVELDDGKHPILLDQPEDDLDNRSIYDDLVQFIRDTKKKRQVIIVTHNPNIVIGTDSEQVIVTNQKGQDKALGEQEKQFNFAAGAIENSFNDSTSNDVLNRMGIREHICQILEGGEEAFKKRDQRYAIKR